MSSGTVIFDFDGTIADSLAVIVTIFNKLANHDKQVLEDEVTRFRQMSPRKVIEELAMPKWRIPYLLFRGRKKMGQRINEVQIFHGMQDVIQQLHSSGYKLYVVSSNSTQNVQKFLSNQKLNEYFQGVYGGAGIFGKAHSIKRIIKSNKLDVTQCVYIGDEARDIEASRHSGVKCIAVGWGFNAPELLAEHNPDALANEPKQLIDIIAAWHKV